MTRTERRQAYFRKQKQFFKDFAGTVAVDGMLIRVGKGKQVVDAEELQAGVKPDIIVTADEIEFRDQRNVWACNPTLVEEFIAHCVRHGKKFL